MPSWTRERRRKRPRNQVIDEKVYIMIYLTLFLVLSDHCPTIFGEMCILAVIKTLQIRKFLVSIAETSVA